MRNKLKIEETNKNRNATYVRNDSVKNLLNTLFPRENEKKMKQTIQNTLYNNCRIPVRSLANFYCQ